MRQMTATVDYYKINLTDTIGVIDSVTVYQNCFNYNGISNPNYDPNNPFCQLIGRQSSNGGRALALQVDICNEDSIALAVAKAGAFNGRLSSMAT